MTTATETTERVRTYRHPNGGGQKVYPAQASPDSYLDEHTTLEGETNLYNCAARDSAFKDTFAHGVRFRSALVCDSRLTDSLVRNSAVDSCDIAVAEVVDSRLAGCRIFSESGMMPKVWGVSLSGVTVYGDVVLTGPWGLQLEGAHIHAGVWSQQPRHMLVEGRGIHVAVVECTEGRAHMGCDCQPVAYWLEKGARLARLLKWDEAQIENCLEFMKGLAQ